MGIRELRRRRAVSVISKYRGEGGKVGIDGKGDIGVEGVVEGRSGRWRYCFEGKELGKGTEGREGSDRYWQVEGNEGRRKLREDGKKGVEGEGCEGGREADYLAICQNLD